MDKTGGLEKNDLGALTAEQQRKLNEFKVTPVFLRRMFGPNYDGNISLG